MKLIRGWFSSCSRTTGDGVRLRCADARQLFGPAVTPMRMQTPVHLAQPRKLLARQSIVRKYLARHVRDATFRWRRRRRRKWLDAPSCGRSKTAVVSDRRRRYPGGAGAGCWWRRGSGVFRSRKVRLGNCRCNAEVAATPRAGTPVTSLLLMAATECSSTHVQNFRRPSLRRNTF